MEEKQIECLATELADIFTSDETWMGWTKDSKNIISVFKDLNHIDGNQIISFIKVFQAKIESSKYLNEIPVDYLQSLNNIVQSDELIKKIFISLITFAKQSDFINVSKAALSFIKSKALEYAISDNDFRLFDDYTQSLPINVNFDKKFVLVSLNYAECLLEQNNIEKIKLLVRQIVLYFELHKGQTCEKSEFCVLLIKLLIKYKAFDLIAYFCGSQFNNFPRWHSTCNPVKDNLRMAVSILIHDKYKSDTCIEIINQGYMEKWGVYTWEYLFSDLNKKIENELKSIVKELMIAEKEYSTVNQMVFMNLFSKLFNAPFGLTENSAFNKSMINFLPHLFCFLEYRINYNSDDQQRMFDYYCYWINKGEGNNVKFFDNLTTATAYSLFLGCLSYRSQSYTKKVMMLLLKRLSSNSKFHHDILHTTNSGIIKNLLERSNRNVLIFLELLPANYAVTFLVNCSRSFFAENDSLAQLNFICKMLDIYGNYLTQEVNQESLDSQPLRKTPFNRLLARQFKSILNDLLINIENNFRLARKILHTSAILEVDLGSDRADVIEIANIPSAKIMQGEHNKYHIPDDEKITLFSKKHFVHTDISDEKTNPMVKRKCVNH